MRMHFIAGLPRAGSTLLAAILTQNPRFQAGVASPLHGVCMSVLQTLGAASEFSVFVSDETRRRMLRGLFEAYHDSAPDQTAFDTARLWSGKLPLIAALFPEARVICCVRDLRWVLDSAERIYRRNPLQSAALFEHNPNTTVQMRLASMMEPTKGFVGAAWSALRDGWCGEQAALLIVLRYESLVAAPAAAVARLYEALDETPFAHDFDRLAFAASEYDARLGMPGLHHVSGPVRREARSTVLPRELFDKHAGLDFWANPADNSRGVLVI